MHGDSLFQRKTAGCTIGIVNGISPVFLDSFRVFAMGCLVLTFLKKTVTLVLQVFSTLVSATGCHDQRYVKVNRARGGDK